MATASRERVARWQCVCTVVLLLQRARCGAGRQPKNNRESTDSKEREKGVKLLHVLACASCSGVHGHGVMTISCVFIGYKPRFQHHPPLLFFHLPCIMSWFGLGRPTAAKAYQLFAPPAPGSPPTGDDWDTQTGVPLRGTKRSLEEGGPLRGTAKYLEEGGHSEILKDLWRKGGHAEVLKDHSKTGLFPSERSVRYHWALPPLQVRPRVFWLGSKASPRVSNSTTFSRRLKPS